jgi:SAM-dependent methyltransferase
VSGAPPLPPPELVLRAGGVPDPEDPLADYVQRGRQTREQLERLLPVGWAEPGRRLLDFGCATGRVLRHFLEVSDDVELHGCDIDEPSIAWLEQHLSPPLHVFVSREEPPLPRPDDFFDAVWALSVFTHLTDHWAAWLLELRRVLKPGGVLIATYLHENPAYERIGMSVLEQGLDWDRGGPVVLHSAWWLREHWGRAFEVERLAPYECGRGGPEYDHYGAIPIGQGFAVLRKPAEPPPSLEELQRIDGGDRREVEALVHNIRQLHAESRRYRAAAAEYDRTLRSTIERYEHALAAAAAIREEARRNAQHLQELTATASWRLMQPLRWARARLARPPERGRAPR